MRLLSPKSMAGAVGRIEVIGVHIKTIEPIAVSLPMLKPVIMAGEEVRRADNVLVRIETDNGLVGWGEAWRGSDA